MRCTSRLLFFYLLMSLPVVLLGQSSQKSTGTIKSVTIKKLVWMVDNLDVSTFRNGDPIPEAKTDEEWVKAGKEKKPAWCYYNNDPANGKLYGKLYNWYAAIDPRGLAPVGWRVPTSAMWDKLNKTLQADMDDPRPLTSTTGWLEDRNGTDLYGFKALPGGSRIDEGVFEGVGASTYWWTTTPEDATWSRYGALGGGTYFPPSYGLSVRCVKE